MKRRDLKRVIRTGRLNFKRNGLVSYASILVVTITLSVITSIIFLQAILKNSLTEIQSRVDVTVYFIPDTQESTVTRLKTIIEQLPQVKNVVYTSAETALDNFRVRHQDDYLTLQALDEISKNPLGASLDIIASEPSQYETIVKFLESDDQSIVDIKPSIDKINYNQNKLVIDRLNNLIAGANKLGVVLTIIMIVLSVIITFNTIRLTIYYSREEIGIMRLVGASNWYIRGPFIIEGIIYGFIAMILALIIFFPIALWLGNNLTDFLGINMLTFYWTHFFEIAWIDFLCGVLLGTLSSVLAIRKYLKK